MADKSLNVEKYMAEVYGWPLKASRLNGAIVHRCAIVWPELESSSSVETGAPMGMNLPDWHLERRF